MEGLERTAALYHVHVCVQCAGAMPTCVARDTVAHLQVTGNSGVTATKHAQAVRRTVDK